MPERSKRGRRTRRPTKDRVLQARIPEHLDEELRDRAEQLGLSVSTIVRNTLLHTFDLVEGVVADSAKVARVIQGRGETVAMPLLPPPGPADPEHDSAVIGWQEAVLNRNGVCDQCNTILTKGERAAIGVPVQARPVIMCLACLADLSPERGEQTEAPGAAAVEKSPAKSARRSKKSAK